MPANGRGEPFKWLLRQVPQKIYRHRKMVRVKRCGKSAPRAEQSVRQGKPHAEQDQIGEKERPVPLDSRVGCLSRIVMSGLRGMAIARKGTETGL